METPWVGKEERQKDNKIIEDMRQRRREMEQEAKQMERAGKFNLAMTLSTQANTLVSDIIKLEDLISDRETGQPNPAWRVSLKEQELLDELEALEDEYSNQKRRMREACDKHIDEVIKKRDEELEKLEQKLQDEITKANYKKEEALNKHKEEILRLTLRLDIAMKNKEDEEAKNVERKKKKISYLTDKKDCLLENQKMPVSLKKMKRQLSDLIERFPHVRNQWVSQGYKLEDLKEHTDIPIDYKQHRLYKNKRKELNEKQLEIPKTKTESPEPKNILILKNETPLSEKIKIPKGGSEFSFSVQAEAKTPGNSFSTPPIRKQKTATPIKSTFTVLIPNKKWLEYSQEERNAMSNYDAFQLEQEWKDELSKERQRKDKELADKISKENDEAEADAIRDMRKAEEAQKEWEKEEFSD